MIKYLSCVAYVLVAASCSKQFSYVDAYKFDKHIYTVKANAVDSSSRLLEQNEPGVLTASTEQLGILEPAKKVKYERVAAIFSKSQGQVIHHTDTVAKPASKNAPMQSRNWAAVTGFTLGLVIFPLGLFTAVPGLIFSIIGLKSERRKLAIAGICLNSLFLLFIAYLFFTDFYFGN
jgi:hypothetical protein